MSDLTLVIGNKNLSTWSLRPWIALTHFEIPFKEEKVLLDQPDSKEQLAKHSPSALVPCLVAGDLAIWDSLAICEYAAEQYPDLPLWPRDPASRAIARSVSAEMHSGFPNLRQIWPMHVVKENLGVPADWRVRKDVQRIEQIWTECRELYGAVANGEDAGPFLFGQFSIADAMYAPVASRFRTYGPVQLNPKAQGYMDAVWNLPAMQTWIEGARKEVEGV